MPQQQPTRDTFDPIAAGGKPHTERKQQEEFDPLAQGGILHESPPLKPWGQIGLDVLHTLNPVEALDKPEAALGRVANRAKGFAEGTIGLVGGVAGLAKETLMGRGASAGQEAFIKPMQQQAELAEKAPRYSAERYTRGAASGVPMFGPWAANIVDSLRAGKSIDEIIGENAAYLAVPEAVGKLPGVFKGTKTLPEVVQSLQQIVPRVKWLSSNRIEPALPHFLRTLNEHPELSMPREPLRMKPGMEQEQAVSLGKLARTTHADLEVDLVKTAKDRGDIPLNPDKYGLEAIWNESAKKQELRLKPPSSGIARSKEVMSRPITLDRAIEQNRELHNELFSAINQLESGQRTLDNLSPEMQGKYHTMEALQRAIADTLSKRTGVDVEGLVNALNSTVDIERAALNEVSKQPPESLGYGLTSDLLRGVGGYTLIRGLFDLSPERMGIGMGELVVGKPGYFKRKLGGGPAHIFEKGLKSGGAVGPAARVGNIPIPEREILDELVSINKANGMTEDVALQDAVMTFAKHNDLKPAEVLEMYKGKSKVLKAKHKGKVNLKPQSADFKLWKQYFQKEGLPDAEAHQAALNEVNRLRRGSTLPER